MVYDLNGTTLSTGGSSSGMLNVLDYGFKGDGTTDNLAAFNDLVAARPGETLYFPKGVYAFSGKLVLDFCYMELDNAELKCTAATKVDRFVEIRGKMTPIGHPRQDMFIRGNGKVNANFKADDCIAVARQKCTLIDHISIQNFQRYGICGKFDDASMETEGLVEKNLSYELMVRNCLIETSLIYKYAVGIYDTGDSMYTDIVILNVKTALSCNGSSIFHNIHAWCGRPGIGGDIPRFRQQRPRYQKGPAGRYRLCIHSREWPPFLGLLLRHLPERIQILRRAYSCLHYEFQMVCRPQCLAYRPASLCLPGQPDRAGDVQGLWRGHWRFGSEQVQRCGPEHTDELPLVRHRAQPERRTEHAAIMKEYKSWHSRTRPRRSTTAAFGRP